MKRMIAVLAAVLITAVITIGCGSDGGKEAGSIIKSQADVTEAYVNDLTSAENAEDVVKAIDNYTSGMKKLIPQIQEFQKKYPEYQNGDVPKGMEADLKTLENASSRLPGAMMKTASYMMDPKVQEAMRRMGDEMGKLQQN